MKRKCDTCENRGRYCWWFGEGTCQSSWKAFSNKHRGLGLRLWLVRISKKDGDATLNKVSMDRLGPTSPITIYVALWTPLYLQTLFYFYFFLLLVYPFTWPASSILSLPPSPLTFSSFLSFFFLNPYRFLFFISNKSLC